MYKRIIFIGSIERHFEKFYTILALVEKEGLKKEKYAAVESKL